MLRILRKFFCRHVWMEPASRDNDHLLKLVTTMWINCAKCGKHLYIAVEMPRRNESIEVRLEARRVLLAQLKHAAHDDSTRWWKFM